MIIDAAKLGLHVNSSQSLHFISLWPIIVLLHGADDRFRLLRLLLDRVTNWDSPLLPVFLNDLLRLKVNFLSSYDLYARSEEVVWITSDACGPSSIFERGWDHLTRLELVKMERSVLLRVQAASVHLIILGADIVEAASYISMHLEWRWLILL